MTREEFTINLDNIDLIFAEVEQYKQAVNILKTERDSLIASLNQMTMDLKEEKFCNRILDGNSKALKNQVDKLEAVIDGLNRPRDKPNGHDTPRQQSTFPFTGNEPVSYMTLIQSVSAHVLANRAWDRLDTGHVNTGAAEVKKRVALSIRYAETWLAELKDRGLA